MNKTIIININGIIFHIEEEAYAVLQSYMMDVKRHFGHSVDSDEIVNDIENRIAEMLNERIHQHKAVITMQDVEEVCSQMGNVHDFAEGEEASMKEDEFQEHYYRHERALFRDPDDKWLGGVCSGLAHYFGVDTTWVRIALLVLFLFVGTGILLYIILWIVMPVARTRSEKMRMRGEPTNLQNFKKSFEEDMGDIKRNFTAAGNAISPGLKHSAKQAGKVIGHSARVIVKIIGIFVIALASIGFVVGVMALLAMLGFIGPVSWQSFLPTNFISPEYYVPFIFSCFVVVAVPLILLILLALRMLSTVKISKYFGFSMLIIWLIALFSIVYYGMTIGLDYAERGTYTEKITLAPDSVFHFSLNDLTTITHEMDSIEDQAPLNRRISNRKAHWKDIRAWIYINKIDSGMVPSAEKEYSAKGATIDIALRRAQEMHYSILQKGEHLIFDSHATILHNELDRDQHIRIKVNIPVGTTVKIDRSLQYYVGNLDFNECADRYPDRQKPEVIEWLMTASGLECRLAAPILPADSNQTAVTKDGIR